MCVLRCDCSGSCMCPLVLGRGPRIAAHGASGIPLLPPLTAPPAIANRPAGEGLSLLAGDYTQPLSFTGIMNFAKWGLRLLVRALLS